MNEPTLADIRIFLIMTRAKENIVNTNWTVELSGALTSFSVSKVFDNSSCLVAVCQSKGIGSFLVANENGVRCLIGSREDGLQEAFARSLVDSLGTKQVVLTMSVSSISPGLVKELLTEIITKFSVS